MALSSTTQTIPNEFYGVFILAEQSRLPVTDLLNTVERIRKAGSSPALVVELYQRWLAHHQSPLSYAVWFNLGVTFADAGEFQLAIDSYQQAIAMQNSFLPARFNLGTALEKLKQPDAAIKVWQDILAEAPACLTADPDVHKLTLNSLGRLLEIKRQFPEAEAYLKQSLQLNCEQPKVIQHWLHLRQKQCAWPLLGDWPGDCNNPEQALMAASGLSSLALTDDPAQQHSVARRFIETKVKLTQTRMAEPGDYAHERLRIGYLSGDFCMHPVAFLMVDLFEQHNRQRFEIFGYCWSPEDNSSLRQRVISAMDHFVRIDALDDQAAARRIRNDEIDILIDLQGLTAGFRPNLLAYRPAPVQITYLGFPGTSGHPEVDYIIADEFVIPAEQASHYSEKPLHLPLCFQPSDRKRAVAPPLTRSQYGLPEIGVVFCCFNNNYKITPEIFALWMRILNQVADSTLWLLAANPWARANLLAAAKQHGIDPGRLIFAERVAPPIYLAQYQLADLFLDTFPFNAGTTANDALWQGLPLLTLSGLSFASRMAGSLLHALGLPDMVTSQPEEYVARAIELATQPERLHAIKLKLAAAQKTSPVFDMGRFTRDLEAAYSRVAAEPTAQSTSQPVAKPEQAVTQKTVKRQRFLHVGCGAQSQHDTLPVFNDGNWDEIRLDIDPAAKPDLLASMTDISGLAHGSVDAIYSSHNIEHLYPQEVPIALREFLRVLHHDGFIVITCPDLQSICALVAENRLTDAAYISPAGPIAALDMLYGHRAALSQGHLGMSHRTGFTRDTLERALKDAGFGGVAVIARPEQFALWALATPNILPHDEWQKLSRRVTE